MQRALHPCPAQALRRQIEQEALDKLPLQVPTGIWIHLHKSPIQAQDFSKIPVKRVSTSIGQSGAQNRGITVCQCQSDSVAIMLWSYAMP